MSFDQDPTENIGHDRLAAEAYQRSIGLPVPGDTDKPAAADAGAGSVIDALARPRDESPADSIGHAGLATSDPAGHQQAITDAAADAATVTERIEPYHQTPVYEFHQMFDCPIAFEPTVPSLEQRLLRVKLIAEELVEFAEACGVKLQITHRITAHPAGPDDRCDLVEAADGLADMRYLVDGGNVIFGFPGHRVLAEVHRSNMSKLGADGLPVRREDGKIIKGPNYFKPNIADVLGLTPSAPDTPT